MTTEQPVGNVRSVDPVFYQRYTDWLHSKIELTDRSGFAIDESLIDQTDKPHQVVAVRWAANLGRALIAMRFGLGKTRIQCELAKQIYAKTGKKVMVVCPLGVRTQFINEDGPAMGMTWQYVKTTAEAALATTPYILTNYERVRDGQIDPRLLDLGCVSLDEGSILRNLGNKTSEVFKQVFRQVPYRYVCTATPAPNNYKELIYYADFLDVMDRGQALTRFFKRDSSHAGNLTLMPSQEETFWLWVSSWALFVTCPADLGFDNEGYELPAMRVHWHRIPTDHTRAWGQMDNHGQHRLLLDAATGVSEASAEKRANLNGRLAKMLEIMADSPDQHWLLWHDLEDERRAIERVVPQSVSVYGSQNLELREKRILGFSHGEIPILATKPELAGSGCNFQRHCHSAIYLGVGYKFEDFIQSVHRIYRFLQTEEVNIHIIFAESEDRVVDVLKQKWAQYDRLMERMQTIIREYGLARTALMQGMARSLGVDRMEHRGKAFRAINNDCVLEVAGMDDNTIDLIVTSIPFGNHYEYTTKLNDFGHNQSDNHFWQQMDYLIPNLLRVLKPGRLAFIHVKDRILYGHQTPSGFMEVAPFMAETIFAFRKHGFLFEGPRTVVTDVVRENSSTYRLGWTEMTKDASKMGSGLPEYILAFRKAPTSHDNARADDPVTQDKSYYSRGRWQVDAHSLWRSNGNRLLTPEELASLNPADAARIWEAEQKIEPYDYERHVAICEALEARGRLPASYMLIAPKVTRSDADMVWDDVVFMQTLNSNQAKGRRENHICPLPLDMVRRLIRLYSKRGDVVLDPFAGLFTTGYVAIEQDRMAVLIELNSEYFAAGTYYCDSLEAKKAAPTLFELNEFERNLNLNLAEVPAD